MNAVDLLQTAIRRYCIERHARWTLAYDDLVASGKDRVGSNYTNVALSIFPRYNVLNAILVEIERYRAEDFADFDEAKDLFQLAARQATDMFSEKPIGAIDSAAMNEERELIAEFIKELTPVDVETVEPLFYRRVLASEEEANLRDRMRDQWDVQKGYWCPLSVEKPSKVEAFQDAYFEREVGYEALRGILQNHGVGRVFEIREYGPDYELDRSVFEPSYNGAEGFWCDVTLDWIIYASHESSLTIGGWLLDEVTAIWPNWKNRVWETPFYE